MDKVLVVKAIEPNYNTVSGGPPIMVVGGNRGGRPRGTTMRERLGGIGGGLVGVLGALAGRHRSLGGLAQSMVSGGAQGAALGRGLGRRFVGRERQARADMDEEARRDYARMSAEGRFDNRRYDVNERINPATMRRRVAEVNREDELAAQQAREARARQRAQAAAEGAQFGAENRKFAQAYRDLRESLVAAGVPENEIEERMNLFNQTARNQQRQKEGSVGVVDPMEGVTRADGSVVSPQSLVAVSNSIPQLGENSASAEINSIENESDQFNKNRTNDALRGSAPAPDDDEEDEMSPGTAAVVGNMSPSLERLQREKFEREQQGGN